MRAIILERLDEYVIVTFIAANRTLFSPFGVWNVNVARGGHSIGAGHDGVAKSHRFSLG